MSLICSPSKKVARPSSREVRYWSPVSMRGSCSLRFVVGSWSAGLAPDRGRGWSPGRAQGCPLGSVVERGDDLIAELHGHDVLIDHRTGPSAHAGPETPQLPSPHP